MSEKTESNWRNVPLSDIPLVEILKYVRNVCYEVAGSASARDRQMSNAFLNAGGHIETAISEVESVPALARYEYDERKKEPLE